MPSMLKGRRLSGTYWGLQCHWPTMENIPKRCWFKVGNAEDHNSTTSLFEAEGKGKERRHRAEHHTAFTQWTVWKERNLRCFTDKENSFLWWGKVLLIEVPRRYIKVQQKQTAPTWASRVLVTHFLTNPRSPYFSSKHLLRQNNRLCIHRFFTQEM